jgi:hypothetical protein
VPTQAYTVVLVKLSIGTTQRLLLQRPGTSEEKIVKNFAMKFLGLAIRPYRTSIRTRFTQGHRQFTVNAV